MSEPRPTWATAAMVAVGVLGAPMAILGVALVVGALGSSESTGVAVGYIGFLVLSIVASTFKAVRPLGIGMASGALALALMFLLQGGIDG